MTASLNQPPTPPAQTDIPVTVTPSPLDMPGAKPSVNPPVVTMPPTSVEEFKPTAPQQGTPEGEPPAGEPVELERFKAVQRIAREHEKKARDNQADAEKWRQIQAALGVTENGGNAAPVRDPLVEIEALRKSLDDERTERSREQISNTTGVPTSQIHGGTVEEMQASAQSALEWAQGYIQKVTGTPLVAPAAQVNSTDVPGQRTGQIKSRDELKGMPSAQIMAAYKEGRLDNLMGKQ